MRRCGHAKRRCGIPRRRRQARALEAARGGAACTAAARRVLAGWCCVPCLVSQQMGQDHKWKFCKLSVLGAMQAHNREGSERGTCCRVGGAEVGGGG